MTKVEAAMASAKQLKIPIYDLSTDEFVIPGEKSKVANDDPMFKNYKWI